MRSPASDGPPRIRSWEHTVLGLMAYPANLLFAGTAAFLLALPIITWLSAMVAAGCALHAWQVDGDDRVFTGTFRAWRDTWRRSLPLSVGGSAVMAVLTTNWMFLSSRESAFAFVLAAATVPLVVAVLLLVVHLPASAGSLPQAGRRDWLRASAALAFTRPLSSLAVLVVVATWMAVCYVLPTLVPFLGLSVPVMAGLVAARRAAHRGAR